MLNFFSNKKTSKGFTLIELLVVVAIISLLSSVVLASLKEARDKAKATAFRQEVNEFIKALELYHLDNNRYPTGHSDESSTASFIYFFRVSGGKIIARSTPSSLGQLAIFESRIYKYMDKNPVYPFISSYAGDLFVYAINQPALSTNKGCYNQEDTNGYILKVYIKDNSAIAEAFSDWPIARIFNINPSSDHKCFAL